MRRAALVLVLAALAGCGADGAAGTSPSTLHATLVDRDGDGFLEPGPGEPLGGPRAPAGRTLATFAQLTDTHVRDEESPARVPFLDRLGPPVTSTFRPQEAFSTQVLDAAVRAVNRERPQAVVVTGDIIDSAQENELDQALATLDGGLVQPDSGAPGYDGVQAADNPDPFYFRPDNDAPRHPGVLDAAQRAFRAEGLRAPWYPAVGNHDLLVQGEVPATPEIERIATGDQMVVGLDPDALPPLDEESAPAAVNALLTQGDVFGRSETVPPDPRRRHLRPRAMVARLAAATDLVARGDLSARDDVTTRGNASTRDDVTTRGNVATRGDLAGRSDISAAGDLAARLDYSFDVSPAVRGIVLDTVDRAGGSQGVLTAGQLAWLRRELAATGSRWIVVFAHNRLPEAALGLLDRTPRVVAVVSGNSHRNTIAPRDGYWLISTSSLADFPQQARMFRLREADNGAILETWMVDHDGRGLAGVSRELAYLDAQGGRPQGFAGRRTDRNMRLFVQP